MGMRFGRYVLTEKALHTRRESEQFFSVRGPNCGTAIAIRIDASTPRQTGFPPSDPTPSAELLPSDLQIDMPARISNHSERKNW